MFLGSAYRFRQRMKLRWQLFDLKEIDIENSKTVMIVEDNADLCFLLTTILNLEGIKTVVAGGGDEALSKLQTGELPDMIITDMKMAGMSGEVLIEKLRLDARTSGLPVILSTGHSEIYSEAKRMGVQGYLAKPYSVDKVLALTKTFLA